MCPCKLPASDTGRIEAEGRGGEARGEEEEDDGEEKKESAILFVARCNYVGWILAQQGVGAGGMDLQHVALSSQQGTDRDFTLKELEPLVFLQLPPAPPKKEPIRLCLSGSATVIVCKAFYSIVIFTRQLRETNSASFTWTH